MKGLTGEQLNDLIKIYNEKYISCNNPAVHYKTELCIMRLEELKIDSNVEAVKLEDKFIEQNLNKIQNFINLLETEKFNIVSLSHDISSFIEELNYNVGASIRHLNDDILKNRFPEIIDDIIIQFNCISDSYRKVN